MRQPLEHALQDFKYGFRMLLKSRSLSAAAALALMLGIGANTAIFSVVNAVLLKPLPYPQPEQLVRLRETSAPFGFMSIAYPNFLDWRDRNTSFAQMAAFRSDGFNLSGSGAPERVQGRVVSASFFAALAVKPAIGRDFVAEDDQPGASPTVIVSNGFWQRRVRDDSFDGKPVIRDQRHRPADVWRDCVVAWRSRAACVLSAGSTRDEGGPDGCATIRIS